VGPTQSALRREVRLPGPVRRHAFCRSASNGQTRSLRTGGGLGLRDRCFGRRLGEATGEVLWARRGLRIAPARPFRCCLALYPRFFPQLAGGRDRIERDSLPPQGFVPRAVESAVMGAAERDRELIADFAAERAALGKAQVVRVAGRAAADEAPATVEFVDSPRIGSEGADVPVGWAPLLSIFPGVGWV
jgi:hypothetical protein